MHNELERYTFYDELGLERYEMDTKTYDDKIEILKNILNEPKKEQHLRDLAKFIYKSEIKRNSVIS